MKKRGVTLLEIMIVLVILSSMIVVSAPKMKGFHQNNELIGASRDIATLCRYARAQAILTEKKVDVKFDLAEDKYWLDLKPEEFEIRSQGRASLRNERQNPLEEEKVLPKFVNFVEIASDAPDFKVKNNIVRIIYYPDGSATSAYIILQNSKEKKMTIEIPRATGFPEVYNGFPEGVEQILKDMKMNTE